MKRLINIYFNPEINSYVFLYNDKTEKYLNMSEDNRSLDDIIKIINHELGILNNVINNDRRGII